MYGFGRFNVVLWGMKMRIKKKDLITIQKIGNIVMTGIDEEAFKELTLTDYKKISRELARVVDFIAVRVEKIKA